MIHLHLSIRTPDRMRTDVGISTASGAGFAMPACDVRMRGANYYMHPETQLKNLAYR